MIPVDLLPDLVHQPKNIIRSGNTQIDNEVRMFGADLSPSANFTFQSALFNQPCRIILGRIFKYRSAAWLVVGLFLHPKALTLQ